MIKAGAFCLLNLGSRPCKSGMRFEAKFQVNYLSLTCNFFTDKSKKTVVG